jgi:hypothetical protein
MVIVDASPDQCAQNRSGTSDEVIVYRKGANSAKDFSRKKPVRCPAFLASLR